ncbi:hypothetical protein NEOLEDRAFT_1177566 [Neolentinus lepideus HHB14362 ss-1]|uniref:Uncharacterized protein n=1 Tax=Neolentinus lepideus HHB14362 ss-1 TaxID=1314782 RepID=A0A165TF23_9AGAM|nr:hypothetical protein NEOLEDRAFT_1177566 [Neolentinus lepideus HHB14362 ss-1]
MVGEENLQELVHGVEKRTALLQKEEEVMGRFYTQYIQKNSPAKYKPRRSPLKPGPRYAQRSPLASKSVATTKTRPPVPSLGRLSKSKIAKGRGFDKGRNEEHSVFSAYREFDLQDEDEQEDENSGFDEDDLDWDEETTLVAMLQEESPTSSDSDLIALVEQLKAPMSAQSSVLKQDLVQTLVPATKRVKEAHKIMEEKIDVEYGKGLLAFNEASKKVEAMCIQDEEDLQEIYVKHQVSMSAIPGGNALTFIVQTKIKDLFTQVKAAYARRDKIFSDFEKYLDESVEQACADLHSLPATVNQTINALEQKSKDLFKDTGGAAKSREKMLKGLLEKL